jgi:4-amino-4-deoxy-L-arabinose transferase-like glycosyltransferase
MHLLSKASENKYWLFVTVFIISLVFIASIVWIFSHPYGTTWDETAYINKAYIDVQAFKEGGILGLAKSIMGFDRSRPPANRIFVLPITLTFGVSPILLRLISLFFWGISLVFVYLAGSLIAGATAGAFATIFLGLCPLIISSSIRFLTEFPLYLAISLMLYFLFKELNSHQNSFWNWIGLGIALGLGAWSKTTFAFVAVPIILLALLLSWCKMISRLRLNFLLKASGLGIILACPWWLFNFQFSLEKASRSSTKFVRHSFGEPSPVVWAQWLNAFTQSAIGTALTILTIAVLLTVLIRKITKHKTGINSIQTTAIRLCLAGILPLPLAQLLATNHNIRLISPSLIPLSIAVGIMAAATQWTKVRSLCAIALVAFCSQLFVTTVPLLQNTSSEFQILKSKPFLQDSPATVMIRRQQFDWEQLRQTAKKHNLTNPHITYLGGDGEVFNIPQISYPWVKANEPVEVEWLWRYELGDIDWQTINKSIDSSDIVLVTPEYKGYNPVNKDPLDNIHNAELIQQLQNDSQFLKPTLLKLGRFEPIEVLAFIHK